ncbi:MAG: Flp pilus assembly complex ATPase component TadA, partial [Sedimentisphaerales bacterium]|nr:Flp pilus assembly complex ATPase component TadA [Sedimentisphaerales bacterium]
PEPFNSIIWNAVYENATDIHINRVEDGMLVLYRVDGLNHEKKNLTEAEGRKLINQIKTAAGLNSVKSFVPQEAQLKFPDDLLQRDIRVTIVPSGKDIETAHLRILSFPQEACDISNMGFNEKDIETVSNTVNSMGGLILISGVSGSGKTSTMYSFASLMDLRNRIAFSIEDPVEFNLPFAQQLEVDERHNFTMYEGLQTILRMDPDLVMVGEIRDSDSAIVAARAALSGRLVLATIHATDAAGTVDALHYLGVPYYVLGGSLKLIVSQSLLRKLCPFCAVERPVTNEEKELYAKCGLEAPEKLYSATGCKKCDQYGYQGLTAIFEMAKIDTDSSHLVAEGVHQRELRDHFRKNGIQSMLVDGLKKVAQGVTSTEELFRVCDFRIED